MEKRRTPSAHTRFVGVRVELITEPPDKPGHSPILAGWIHLNTIRETGGVRKVYSGICERCGQVISRTAKRETARDAVKRHRRQCYPQIPINKSPAFWGADAKD